ncbi:variant 3, galacturonosyltransferase 5 [Lathyrus oleraceus]|uniref:Hexosyltransferase n=1 Tax=Pisum sativum TaxID=3888 RepID=A0A9D5AYB6_PEA|nr:variant 3, galacturonosyltransferase 5 [Pisum sativum]
MIEKVIAGVGTCQEGETSFRRMDMFINFSNPYIAKRFDVNACTWAFGMNLFDLQQWRRHNLTGVYHKYLQKVCLQKYIFCYMLLVIFFVWSISILHHPPNLSVAPCIGLVI